MGMDLEGIVFAAICHRHKFVYLVCLTLALDVIYLSEAKCELKNFGYLRPISEKVRGGNMVWEAIEFGNRSSIGKNLKYEPTQGMLAVNRGGSYFFHLTLHFTRTVWDTASNVSSKVDVMLMMRVVKSATEAKSAMVHSCEMELPAGGQLVMSVSKTCWAVVPNMKRNSRLYAQMNVHSETDNVFGWKLLSNESGFLIFLVDDP